MGLTLGFYGKLPASPEFIRFGDETGIGTRYKEWFESAWSNLYRDFPGDHSGPDYEGLGEISFLLRFKDFSRPLIGKAIPSRDMKTRPFPFSVFAEVDLQSVHSSACLLPEAHKQFLFIATQRLSGDGREFKACADGIQLGAITALRSVLPLDTTEAHSSFLRFLSQVTLKDFAQQIDAMHGPHALANSIRNLVIAISPMRGAVADDFAAIFRFPLSGAADSATREIGFWASAVEGLLGDVSRATSYFWTEKWFYILFAQPNQSALSAVWQTGKDDDTIWDFAGMKLNSDSDSQASVHRLESLIGGEGSTLRDALSGVGG